MPDFYKRLISTLTGLLLIADSMWLLAHDKIHLGILLPMLIGIILILYTLFFPYIQQWQQKSKFCNNLYKMMWAGFWAWLASVIIFFGFIASNINNENNQRTTKAILVLGSGIENDQPSPTLQKRLDAAAEYAQHHPDALIIMTGGLGFQEKFTEAEVMWNYIKTNYPEIYNPIALEAQSTSTELNLRNSKTILKQHQIQLSDPITIVTSDFHSIRARAIAQHQGYSNVINISAETPLYIRYNAWLREYFAFLSGWLLNEY
ncbi:YdcF family protein [Acinetobacter sp. ANC 7454]|uniref:YdcF family protein n=1 Tax=Acinetobacter thermotolerans TaxID=3151487 RepID=UPI00325B5A63